MDLSNAQLFSSHCFRRSSACHLAKQGGDLITIKKHGNWKYSAVAEGYVGASLKEKIKAPHKISTQPEPSTS